MKRSFLFILFLLLLSGRVTSAPFTIYVATNGNDGWSGTLPAPASNDMDGPVRNASAALIAARKFRQNADQAASGVSIVFRGGRHELSEPLVLLPEDSGASSANPFTLASYPGERPIISGGRALRGWAPVPGKPGLWQLEIPRVREGKWYFRTLFVNGHRAQRARTPNSGFYRIQGGSPQDKPVKIHFTPGDIKKEWAEDGDVELIAYLAWADLRMQIRAVDEQGRVATLSGTARPSNQESNAQYYIENAPDGLDQPGEWYLNKRTGIVTYWAKPGEDMKAAEVIAPELEDLLIMRGDFAAKHSVHDVVIRGLTFSHTDWSLSPQGYADTQAAVATRGDFLAEGAVDCRIEGCSFTGLAGYALELGRGCQRIQVVGNEMSDLGGGGIRIGEAGKRTEPFEENNSHTITDNHIHHGGLIYPPAIGIFVLQSGTNRIAHNHIHDLYYTAISLGWNWGYQETPCCENIVEFNHLHDIGQGRLSDMGAVYTLGIQRGTIIRNNLIHDVDSFTYGGWGLYTDEGSSNILLENNVVYHCKSAGFHQHYGRDNIVRNNIFAFNREVQIMRTRAEDHSSFIFTNNIVLFDTGGLLGSNWSNDHYVMERNVYWDTRLEGVDKWKFADGNWDQWHSRGHDTNSIIADPNFVNGQKFDFRLKAESPALKLGFKPIELGTVGVRAERDR
ncbi:MAG: hypothetical protein JWN25_1564 [Verrucomicrobiales bacterium]|nr:hypothetical protein [Verrucomicrobiales bacterium]